MLWFMQIMVFICLSCRCLHTIRKSRTYCGLYKSWYLSVYLVGFYILSGNPEHIVVNTNHGICLFYLVGVYILSCNPENVVIYIYHGFYLFYLVGVYILSGNPEHVVVYADHGIYLFIL